MNNSETALRTSTQLAQSVEHVQELLRQMADELYRHLLPQTSPCGPFVELQRSLPSQVQAISPFVTQLMRFIAKFRNADGTENNIEMAVRARPLQMR